MDPCEIQTIEHETSMARLASTEDQRVAAHKFGDTEMLVPFELHERLKEFEAEEPQAQLKTFVGESKANDDDTFDMVGSDESVDRDGDIIRVRGWQLKDFKKNPVLLWGHNHREPPIGVATKVVKDLHLKQLRFRLRFAAEDLNPFAGVVRRLYEAKIVKASSVGFIPLEWKIPDSDEAREQLGLGKWGVEFTKQELMELSIVSIGSNRNALAASVGSALVSGKLARTDFVIAKEHAGDTDLFDELEKAYESLHRVVLNSEHTVVQDQTDATRGVNMTTNKTDPEDETAGPEDELLKAMRETAQAMASMPTDDPAKRVGSCVGDGLYDALFAACEDTAKTCKPSE